MVCVSGSELSSVLSNCIIQKTVSLWVPWSPISQVYLSIAVHKESSHSFLWLLNTPWSDQISHSVVSDSLWPHESQHARPPCLSPTPRVHPDSGPSSQWCHPAISSSVVPFSSCPQSLPASESFPMSNSSHEVAKVLEFSSLASFLPEKSQGWSPSEWTSWISLQSKGLRRTVEIDVYQSRTFFTF